MLLVLRNLRQKNAHTRATLIALHAQKMRKSSQKNYFHENYANCAHKYGHFLKTLIESVGTWPQTNRRLNCIIYKTNKKYYEVSTLNECVEKNDD